METMNDEVSVTARKIVFVTGDVELLRLQGGKMIQIMGKKASEEDLQNGLVN